MHGGLRIEIIRPMQPINRISVSTNASARSAGQASNVLECIVCDSGLTKYAIIHLILDIGT